MEENYNKQIGNRIKLLRENKGEYQKETAESITKMGEKLSEGQLGLYEIGARKIPPNILRALAIHFKVTTDYLLGCKDTINDPIKIAASTKDNIDLSDIDEEDKKTIMKIYSIIKNKNNDK